MSDVKKLLVILSCVALFISQDASASSDIAKAAYQEPIKIVSEYGPPLNYYDKKTATIKGYSYQLIKAVMDGAGLDFEVKIKPWARAFRDVSNNKNMLIYSMGRTKAREHNFIWLGKIITVKNYIYRLRQPDKAKPKALLDIRKEWIGVSKSSLNNNYLKSKNFENLIYLTDLHQTFELLSRKRMDYFTSSVLGILQFLKDNNRDPSFIEPVLRLQDHNPVLYFAANINTDVDLIKRIKKSFERIVANGTYDKIMNPLLEEQRLMRLSIE